MIFGELDALEQFRERKALYEALKFLKNDASALPDGRHDIVDGMFADIKRYNPAPKSGRLFESHVRYADVQCVLEGEEVIFVRPRLELRTREDLLEERDLVYYHEPADGQESAEVEIPFLMRPGYFLLLPPADVHKTECLTTAASGRKVILKLPVELL